jgi:hypothetical protein
MSANGLENDRVSVVEELRCIVPFPSFAGYRQQAPRSIYEGEAIVAATTTVVCAYR